jgi:hypothetical protein
MTLLLLVLLSPPAQVAGQGKERTQDEPGSLRRPLRNEVFLQLEYYYDQQDPNQHQQHPGSPYSLPPFGIQSAQNRFSMHANYYFRPPQELIPGPPIEASSGPSIEMSLSEQTLTLGADFGNVTRILTGNPFNPPPTTKPGLFGGDGADDEDSDRVPLTGPELVVPLDRDVSAWSPASWLPRFTELHAYGRALYGSFEVFGEDADLQLYGIGPRLLVPLVRESGWTLGASISAGLGFLKSDLGDALGLEASGGIRGRFVLTRGMAFVSAVGLTYFEAEDVSTWGPTLNVGLTLSW